MAPLVTGHTTPEAARRLGVGTSTLRRWADEGKVPHTRLPSGRLRFSDDDLATAIERHERVTVSGDAA